MRIRRANERGSANHGWLDTRHTFSFARYYDPRFMGFSDLRVINEDRVTPGRGFGTHGHRDMEIVSYVLEGALAHKDSMGSGETLRPGEVQVMSAGTGVTHSEFNADNDNPLHFLQIWIMPARPSTTPRYEQKAFGWESRTNAFQLMVSGDGRDGSLQIGQDAALWSARIDDDVEVAHVLAEGRVAWIHVARGAVEVDGVRLEAGDGAALDEPGQLKFRGISGAEVLFFDLRGES